MAKELDNKKMLESILIQIDKSPYDTVHAYQIHNALKDQGFKFDGEHIVPIEEIKGNNGGVSHNIKEGDWVVYQNEAFQVTRNGNSDFLFLQGRKYQTFFIESECRPFTIEDVKDGDLIYVSTEEKGIQAIFHEYKNQTIFFHCYLCRDFVQGGYMPIGDVELVYPLQETHYKRFFEKMHDAGYEWDAEKKELKKIEQKPTWSEDDEQLYNDLSDTYFYNDEDYPEETYKLMLKRVLDWMTNRAKFLRPRPTWKPSDEQMEALETAIRCGEEDSIGILALLYNDLKKLREE